ncbi:MAG: hypothetical protein ACW98D_11935 [Promethearchaeota archaeon]|jgi:hypothetical protein
MAVTKLVHSPEITTPDNNTRIRFICPVCKSQKSLQVPKSIIDKAKGLTTMSIAKGLVCGHQFQAYVDKNFAVRGYQRVDFEFEKIIPEKSVVSKSAVKDDKELFDNLVLEGNYLEYIPNWKKEKKEIKHQTKKIKSEDKTKPLQELYDEFWEFIDENNKIFQDFIRNDERRKGGRSINTFS